MNSLTGRGLTPQSRSREVGKPRSPGADNNHSAGVMPNSPLPQGHPDWGKITTSYRHFFFKESKTPLTFQWSPANRKAVSAQSFLKVSSQTVPPSLSPPPPRHLHKHTRSHILTCTLSHTLPHTHSPTHTHNPMDTGPLGTARYSGHQDEFWGP